MRTKIPKKVWRHASCSDLKLKKDQRVKWLLFFICYFYIKKIHKALSLSKIISILRWWNIFSFICSFKLIPGSWFTWKKKAIYAIFFVFCLDQLRLSRTSILYVQRIGSGCTAKSWNERYGNDMAGNELCSLLKTKRKDKTDPSSSVNHWQHERLLFLVQERVMQVCIY